MSFWNSFSKSWLKTSLATVLLCFSSTSFATANAQAPDPELREALRKAINSSASFENKYVAEVWLLDMSTRMSRYVKNPEQRIAILKAVHHEATQLELDPELVLSVMHVESLFRKYAISRVGARGLMQIMPFWKKELDLEDANLFDIQTNIRMGCTILKFYMIKEKGNVTRALARYNGSVGSVRYPNKVFKARRKYWFTQ